MSETFRGRLLWELLCFEFYENVRNRWLLFYGLFFLLASALIVYFGGNDPRQATGSLLGLTLLVVPLFSLLFACFSFFDSLPFLEILLMHSVSRGEVFLGKWLGLSLGAGLACVLGLGMGSLANLNLEREWGIFFLLPGLGFLLSFLFSGISFLLSCFFLRRERVFGLILLLWLFFYLMYDFLVLGIVILFADYPLESVVLALAFLNPVDLVRIVVTLQLNVSAMIGPAGALLTKYLGGVGGVALAFLCLLLWTVLPVFLGLRRFRRRDL